MSREISVLQEGSGCQASAAECGCNGSADETVTVAHYTLILCLPTFCCLWRASAERVSPSVVLLVFIPQLDEWGHYDTAPVKPGKKDELNKQYDRPDKLGCSVLPLHV